MWFFYYIISKTIKEKRNIEFNMVRSDSVRFSSVWFESVRFGSVRFSSVRFGSVRFGSVRFGSVQFGLVRFGTVRYSTVRFGSIRFDSVWFDSSSIQWHHFALHAHIFTHLTHATYTWQFVDRYVHTALLSVFWWSVFSQQNVAKIFIIKW